MNKMLRLPTRVKLDYTQNQAVIEARVAFMRVCPFFCHYYYDKMDEYFTYEIPTLATDGVRCFINPNYLSKLDPVERAFALAHETNHAVRKHPQRGTYYRNNGVKGLPYDHILMNTAMDYVINYDLVKGKIGACHPSWLYDPKYTDVMLPEDVYVDLYNKRAKQPPQPPQPPGPCNNPTSGTPTPTNQPPNTSGHTPKTYRDQQKSTRHDVDAEANNGAFDEIYEPFVDANGNEDTPEGVEFKEAIARAAAAAKAMGKMPANFQRLVDEILEPQVNWREQIRMIVTGRVKGRKDNWERPNRRRLVLNPLVIMPGQTGYGAGLVAVWIDNSGSISKREYNTFFSEVGAIINDVRPKRLLVGWCDAKVQRTAWARSLDEFFDKAYEPTPGGGGTDFRPPFAWMKEEGLTPETLIYFTDMYGPFPDKKDAPSYPVVWCATSSKDAPFGETVHLKMD